MTRHNLQQHIEDAILRLIDNSEENQTFLCELSHGGIDYYLEGEVEMTIERSINDTYGGLSDWTPVCTSASVWFDESQCRAYRDGDEIPLTLDYNTLAADISRRLED